MIINGGRYPEKFPKGPCRLPYLFLITIQPIPLEPVYDLAFLCDVVPIFGCNQEAFGGISPFIVDQDTYHKCLQLVGTEVYNINIWWFTSWDQVPLFTYLFVSTKFSSQPEEAMLFAMVKACMDSNFFLFMSNLKEYFFLYMDLNRMRNLYLHVEREYGKESVIILQQWEDLVRKMEATVTVEGFHSSAYH